MLKIIFYLFGTIAILIIVVLVIFSLAGKNAAEYVGEFKPALSQIDDGTYEGEYSAIFGKIGAKITFNIKNGQLMHYHFDKLYGTFGYGATENVKSQIDQREDLNFDIISGATVTSNLAKAAIRDALEKGPLK
jgi:uncharacterized protein with FMN-binding domain